jgi:hypothetical protein
MNAVAETPPPPPRSPTPDFLLSGEDDWHSLEMCWCHDMFGVIVRLALFHFSCAHPVRQNACEDGEWRRIVRAGPVINALLC